MKEEVLNRVQEKVRTYQRDHAGNKPLYVLMTADEADRLADTIRTRNNYKEEVPVTEFDGIKIVRDPALKSGDILLTNELPETSS